MKHAAEVIVAGGGIAGLAVAIALRQRGVEAVVLEQAPQLGEIGAGLLLGPNACAVLEKLGALPDLLDGHSVPVARVRSLRRSNAGHAVLGLSRRTPASMVSASAHPCDIASSRSQARCASASALSYWP